MSPVPQMMVRVDAVARVGLPARDVMATTARAITELGAAEALVLIHGKERGMARYWSAGGCVRFTSYGDPFIPVVHVPEPRECGPWRKVTGAQLHSGRGSFLGPDTTRRARWWDLALECGHHGERDVRYRPLPPEQRQRGGTQHRNGDDVLPPPRRAACRECRSA